MHLLTPSGLHLSSLYFLQFLPAYVIALLIALLLYQLNTFTTYQSLERVLIFKLLHLFTRQYHIATSTVFLLTLLTSLIIGNYAESPYSFLYSTLFWGTIIYGAENPLKLILNLNLSLHISSYFFNESISLASIVINPVFTGFFVFIFPMCILNALLGGVVQLEWVINIYLEAWCHSIEFVAKIDQLPTVQLSLLTLFLAIYFVQTNRYKLFIFLTLINIPITIPKEESYRRITTKVYNEDLSMNRVFKTKKSPLRRGPL